MFFDLTLDDYLHHHLFKQTEGRLIGPLSIDLPVDMDSYVAIKTMQVADVTEGVSREDILRCWGDFDSYFKYRDELKLQAHEMNFHFLCGIIRGLILAYKTYHVEVMLSDIESIVGLDINVDEYVRDIFNLKN